MMDDMDKDRAAGVEFSLDLWPRGHYKTTILIGRVVQDILCDPDVTIFICHAVEDEVKNIVEEVGEHFKSNLDLRRVVPHIVYNSRKKDFLKALQFTVKRDKYSRQPTVRGASAASEITGAHCDRIYLDDIVGRKTIADSGLPKIKSWFQSTVMPVLNPGGTICVTGTCWDIKDPYQEWRKDSDWKVRHRAAYEKDGVPDRKGDPVLLTRKQLRTIERRMGPSDFAFQYMNDPSPSGDKPWNPSQCEHYVGTHANAEQSLPGAKGKGTVFILSDPAPAKLGAITAGKENERADGTKDEWTLAAVKIMSHQNMQIMVLLEVLGSREWSTEKGLDEACRLMKKWNTSYFFNESFGFGVADFTAEMRKASRRNGTPLYLEKNGQLPKFSNSNQKGAKNMRMTRLAEWAKVGRFYIYDRAANEELDLFLEQARTFIPLPNGKNTLAYDDRLDVVARGTDAALQKFSPQAQVEANFFERLEEEEYESKGRRSIYCGV